MVPNCSWVLFLTYQILDLIKKPRLDLLRTESKFKLRQNSKPPEAYVSQLVGKLSVCQCAFASMY